jgi:hypothetical protein
VPLLFLISPAGQIIRPVIPPTDAAARSNRSWTRAAAPALGHDACLRPPLGITQKTSTAPYNAEDFQPLAGSSPAGI